MNTLRKILREEWDAWDAFVNASPQGNLFHTSVWNDMLRETKPEMRECTYWVCEKSGVFLGGMVGHSFQTKETAGLPMFGYQGPFFSAEINYGEPTRTVPAFEVCQELLKGLTDSTSHTIIKNQPAIWDMRAFAFNRWNIETQYTHELSYTTVKAKLPEFRQHNKENQYSIRREATVALIEKFFKRTSKKNSTAQTTILSRQLHWLIERGLAQFVTIYTKDGKELAVALFLMSKENQTLYLVEIQALDPEWNDDLLMFLIYEGFLTFGDNFDQMDLGESATQKLSQAKDNLGATLTPFFIASK